MNTQNIFQLNIQELYLSYIRDGIKTIEGRLNKGKFKELSVGDLLEIEGMAETFRVLDKNEYKTFLEMVTTEGFENVIPDKTTEIDAANVYYKFFTKDQEMEFGVVAIKIEKI